MKNILFLINTLSGGGAEKVLVETVNSLDKQKYKITIQTIFDVGVNKKYLSKDVEYKAIIPFQNRFLRKIFAKVLFVLLGTQLVYKFFVSGNYDYEIAFLEGLPTKIIADSKNKNCKRYAWIHTDLIEYPDSYKAYGSEKKEREAYNNFDKVFCVSESVKEQFKNKYNFTDNKVEVLYNIIDDEAISGEAKEEADLPTDIRPLLVTVGRLIPQKGYKRLLKVHKNLIENGIKHALLIIGEGEERENLESYILQNNLSDTVFLLGYKTNPHKYVSKADLFICSSLAEGYSTVVSEAVLSNTPVLSVEVSGAREPKDMPRCSVIVENNEQALYEGIKNILEHQEKLKQYKNELREIQMCLKKDFLVSEFECKVLEEK